MIAYTYVHLFIMSVPINNFNNIQSHILLAAISHD